MLSNDTKEMGMHEGDAFRFDPDEIVFVVCLWLIAAIAWGLVA